MYDDEIDFYYLRSRYYNANRGRFINADSVFDGTNLFRYCGNDSINKLNNNGNSPIAIPIYAGYKVLVSLIPVVGFVVSRVIGESYLSTIKSRNTITKFNVVEQKKPIPGPSPTPVVTPRPTIVPETTPCPTFPKYPGNDPLQAPEGYTWRGNGPKGSEQGGYYNPKTNETLHPDLDHNL